MTPSEQRIAHLSTFFTEERPTARELSLLGEQALLRTLPARQSFGTAQLNQAWLIIQGSVALLQVDPEGHSRPLLELGSGSLLGYESLFNQRTSIQTFQVQAPTVVLQWPLDWLVEQSGQLPALWAWMERGFRERSVLYHLAQVPLFSTLSARDRRVLAGSLSGRSFDRDMVVFTEDSPGTALFLIERGLFVVEKAGQPVATLGEGSFFGEMALVSAAPHNATVRAITPARCLELPGTRFQELLEQHSSLASAVRSEITRRIQQSQRMEANPSQQHALQLAVQHGILRGSHVLARIPELCPEGCHICETACADRFGQARLQLNGASIAGWDVTVSCRQCRFAAECVDACPEEALVWEGDALRVNEACTGCGDCVPACPYNAVQLQTIAVEEPHGPLWLLWQRLQRAPLEQPTVVAAKCDLCAGFEDKACLAQCPTGSLRLIPVEELFPL